MTGRADPWGDGDAGVEAGNPWDDRSLDEAAWTESIRMEPDTSDWQDTPRPVQRPPRPVDSPGKPRPTRGQVGTRPEVHTSSGKSDKSRKGWRSLFRGRGISAGRSETDTLKASVSRPLPRAKTVAFINEGGGTGKTTSALLLGLTLALYRPGPIVAVDASPGCGDLANRAPAPDGPVGTVRTVVSSAERISSYEQVRAHTNVLSGGLELLAADASMSNDAVFTGAAYTRLMGVLRQHYDLVITDCAAGMVSDVVPAVLDDADLVVIVSEGGDGVRSSTWTANWMLEHAQRNPRYKQLLDDAVVVVNSRHDRTNANTGKIVDFYRGIVRAVVQLPFDQHLEGGNIIEMNKLADATRHQLMKLADAVMSSAAMER